MKDQCMEMAKEALEQKPEVYGHLVAPDSLLRFLVARDFNLVKAVDMFKKSLAWRLEFQPESITPESIQDLLMT